MLAVSMPKAETALALVESATKCLATALSLRLVVSQSLAVIALVSVSWVVKVLEATMNSVVAGSSLFRVSTMWVPSTLETK